MAYQASSSLFSGPRRCDPFVRTLFWATRTSADAVEWPPSPLEGWPCSLTITCWTVSQHMRATLGWGIKSVQSSQLLRTTPSNFRLCIQPTVSNTMVSLLQVITSILMLTGYSWTVQPEQRCSRSLSRASRLALWRRGEDDWRRLLRARLEVDDPSEGHGRDRQRLRLQGQRRRSVSSTNCLYTLNCADDQGYSNRFSPPADDNHCKCARPCACNNCNCPRG